MERDVVVLNCGGHCVTQTATTFDEIIESLLIWTSTNEREYRESRTARGDSIGMMIPERTALLERAISRNLRRCRHFRRVILISPGIWYFWTPVIEGTHDVTQQILTFRPLLRALLSIRAIPEAAVFEIMQPMCAGLSQTTLTVCGVKEGKSSPSATDSRLPPHRWWGAAILDAPLEARANRQCVKEALRTHHQPEDSRIHSIRAKKVTRAVAA